MADDAETQFEALLAYLKRARGTDLTWYKRPSLMRRICKRMQTVNLDDFGRYIDYLEVHPEEFVELYNTILINVTGFFRDPQAWDVLAREVIPKMIAGKDANEPIRVWTAGCASGEETYSIAMLLAEALGMDAYRQRVKLYASDIDEEALTAARQATYEARMMEGVNPDWIQKYFEQNGGRYIFRNELRRALIFGRHDLISDSPISRLDLLICRNVLMYFNAEMQNRILARFHFALNDNGFLFLGKAEMLLTHANLFTPVDQKNRVFAKVTKASLRDRLMIMTQAGDDEAGNRLARQIRSREVAFDLAPVPQIVVDADGNLTYANDRARTLFGLVARDVGRRFQDLELSYRPAELRSLIEQAYAERQMVSLSNVQRQLNGRVQFLDIDVIPIQDNGGSVLGVSITFTDVSRYHRLQEDIQRSKQELETAYEELQSTNEELETTNEELQSTVEELETTNEELQSTNEELETMNEELQSTNEELQTVNGELRTRTDDLHRVNGFLESILSSLRTAVVVVDDRMTVLSWNHQAEEFWGLRADEVKGQPFSNLDIGLPVGDIVSLVRNCVSGSTSAPDSYQERAVTALNRRGRQFTCRVGCTPLFDGKSSKLGAILMMEERAPQT